MKVQLAHQVEFVSFDGLYTQIQLSGSILDSATTGQEEQDLVFPGRQDRTRP